MLFNLICSRLYRQLYIYRLSVSVRHRMETSTHLQSLEQMVSCSVCGDVLTEAFTLPCYHNMCQTHKQELVIEVDKHDQEGVRCPICNTFAKTSETGTTVKLMKELVEAYSKVGVTLCDDFMAIL